MLVRTFAADNGWSAHGAPRSPTLRAAGGVSITDVHDDLAQSLRVWRDRLDPAELGLPRQSPRRAPGLRREEVAALAGISVNYLTRLEQGRAQAPSVGRRSACPRAAPRCHRGRASPPSRRPRRSHRARRRSPHHAVRPAHPRSSRRRTVVVDAAWAVVAGNALARAFLGGDVVGENVARQQFVGPGWIEHEAHDADGFERDLAGDLHRQLARHPDDRAVRAIVDELLATSERFAALWAERPVRLPASSRKTVRHAEAGRITVDCDVLEVMGTDLRVVIWTAPPGSPDAGALALLGVVSLQRFDA